MRAIGPRAPSACAYDLEILWADSVLLSEHVCPPVPFVLTSELADERSGRTFVLDEQVLGAARRALVSVHDGAPWFEAGTERAPLRAGTSQELTLGALRVRVTGSDPEPVASLRTAPALHTHAWTLASFAVHALALACMALLPPRASSLSLDLASEDVRTLRYLSMALSRDAEPLPFAQGASTHGGTPTPAETKLAAAAGRPRTSKKPGRPSPTLEASQAGILDVLARSVSPLPLGPYADALDYDPRAALTALMGGLPGENEGIGGLALRGPGRGAVDGASGTIGVGSLDTGTLGELGRAHGLPSLEHRARVPRARMVGDAVVRGSLSREVIRRTIQRHLNEVRFCYESALRTRPELAGRVSVSFLIAPSGAVQASSLADSSLGHALTESCIVQAVRRWSFPAPDGGGYVQVSYPFLLEQR